MKKRSHETHTIVEHISDVEDGTFVPYSILTEKVGLDTMDPRGTGRARVYSAIRILGQMGINTETRKGGVYRLLPDEYFQTTTKAIRRNRNQARRALVKTVRGLSADVPEESRNRLTTERAVLSMQLAISSHNNQKRIAEQVDEDTERKAVKLKVDLREILS